MYLLIWVNSSTCMLKCIFLQVQLKWIISGIGIWVLTTVHVWWKLQSKISSEHIADSLQQIFFKKTNLFVIRALDQIATIGGKVLLTGWRIRPMMKCNFSLPPSVKLLLLFWNMSFLCFSVNTTSFSLRAILSWCSGRRSCVMLIKKPNSCCRGYPKWNISHALQW